MTHLLVHRTISPASAFWRTPTVRQRLWIALQLRHYASKRPGPAFDSGKGPTPEEVFTNVKLQSKPQPDFKTGEKNPPRQGLRKYGITPGRLILISILTYFGYRLYNWQTNPYRSLVLNGKFFTPFVLESKEAVSSTSSIFNLLSVPRGQNTYNIAEAWRLGVWSVQVMQPELQIARSYTPLPPNNSTPDEQIRLLVRKEPQGEVSGFLHKLAPGTIVHLRGPHPEYRIPDDIDEILFLAGGTGVAPALQVAYSLYTARAMPPGRTPKMHILWANRRREDSYAGLKPSPVEELRASIMAKVRAGLDFDRAEKQPKKLKQSSEELSEQSILVEEVEALKMKYGGIVNVDYFVDEENTFITAALLREYLSAQDSTSAQADDRPRKKLLLISGPEGFVNLLAGPKGMQGGRQTQGPIGGVLEKIERGNWEVWKL